MKYLLNSILLFLILFSLSNILSSCYSNKSTLLLATTTSTENSGLLDILAPIFEKDTGLHIKIIAVGSGAALQMGSRGDVDVLLVHSEDAEKLFMGKGFGFDRHHVMYNDFILVGPAEDPAEINEIDDVIEALNKIAQSGSKFISRGDASGTHVREKLLWSYTKIKSPLDEEWYIESGQGMGATLTITKETGAYTLSDRGTWLAMRGEDHLPLLLEGDSEMLNRYHVITVNPELHRAVNISGAKQFRDFLLKPSIQRLIGEYGIEKYGQSLFTPNAEIKLK